MTTKQTESKKPEAKQDGPKVLAVFHADCRATKGHGSTVAVVRGGTGKCRLYGRNSLSNAFPDQADVCRTLSSAQAMADHFNVSLITGKEACDGFVERQGVKWDGKEAVLADAGKGNKKRGGFRALNYAAFCLGLILLSGCLYATPEGVGWQGQHTGYFQCFSEAGCSGF